MNRKFHFAIFVRFTVRCEAWIHADFFRRLCVTTLLFINIFFIKLWHIREVRFSNHLKKRYDFFPLFQTSSFPLFQTSSFPLFQTSSFPFGSLCVNMFHNKPGNIFIIICKTMIIPPFYSPCNIWQRPNSTIRSLN